MPQGQDIMDVFERAEAPKQVKTFAPKVIAVPDDLQVYLGKEIRPSQYPEEYPMFHISTFRQLKPDTAKAYMRDFRKAVTTAGYDMTGVPEDPLKFAEFLVEKDVDAWHVMRFNSPDAPTFLSVAEFNARTSAMTSIPVQKLIQLAAQQDRGPVFQKLFLQHFAYHKYGSAGKKATNDKFKLQLESATDRKNKIPFPEWYEISKAFVGKYFYTDPESPKFGQPRKANVKAAELQPAVSISLYTFIPPTRVLPWATTAITLKKPTADDGRMNRYYLTDSWETSAAYFGDYKNATAMQRLLGPIPHPHYWFNALQEHYAKTARLILWNYARLLAKECGDPEGVFLFAAGKEPCDNQGTDTFFGKLVADTAQLVDDDKARRFTTRLMRRSYITFWRASHPEAPLTKQEALLKAMHQVTLAVNIGYNKTEAAAAANAAQADILALEVGRIFAELDDDGEELDKKRVEKIEKSVKRIKKSAEAGDKGEAGSDEEGAGSDEEEEAPKQKAKRGKQKKKDESDAESEAPPPKAKGKRGQPSKKAAESDDDTVASAKAAPGPARPRRAAAKKAAIVESDQSDASEPESEPSAAARGRGRGRRR